MSSVLFVNLQKIRNMELFIALMLLFSSPQCPDKSDFSIERAESQNFAGGTVWSPSGTNYTIELKATRKLRNVNVNMLWVGVQRFTEISVLHQGQATGFTDLSKGESIVLTFSHIIINRPDAESYDTEVPNVKTEHSSDEPATIQPPIEYSGAALICYVEKGKKKYLEIPVFERKNPLLRP
jgi:hypothetical protein